MALRAFLAVVLLAAAPWTAAAKESLHYSVEWRLINAGFADLTFDETSSTLHLKSTGLVSRLFRVDNTFEAKFTKEFCTKEYKLHAEEGSKRRDTKVVFSGNQSKYVEMDLLKSEVASERELTIAACTHDITAALAKLRTMNLAPGQNATMPISDGKKFAQARVEAQQRDKITTKLGTFQTIRHEAFLFNDVIFKRSARLLVWITDDARRLPIQIQVRMRIHIGTVTLQLDTVEP
jgi:hypothetical protein